MKNRNSFIQFLLIASLLSLVFVGCGPGEENSLSRTLLLNGNTSGDASSVLDGPSTPDVKPGAGNPGSFSPGDLQSSSGLFGQVTSADDGSPLAGATVTLLDQNDVVLGVQTTNGDGSFSFGTQPFGSYVIRAELSPQFLTSERPVQFQGGDSGFGVSLTTPLEPGQVRLVLTWGVSPSDLDSHLWLPPSVPFHVFFSRQGSGEVCPFAVLDTDDTSSFGPETITITSAFSGTYEYAVFNFSGEGSFGTSGAFVEVFDENGRVDGFTPPAGGAERWWHVVSIDGDTLTVTPANELLNDFEPYPDTGSGCGSGTA